MSLIELMDEADRVNAKVKKRTAELEAEVERLHECNKVLASDNSGFGPLKAELKRLKAFVQEVANLPHSPMCPLEHPAYKNKWCDRCEAKKMLELPHYDPHYDQDAEFRCLRAEVKRLKGLCQRSLDCMLAGRLPRGRSVVPPDYWQATLDDLAALANPS